jgi:hypothetical protein
MREAIKKIQDTFKANVDSVDKLMKFDEIIQSFCIETLKKVNTFLEKEGLNKHPSCNVESQLNHIKRIRDNQSLKPHYQVMWNQSIVLLVSYFSSAVEALFVTAIPFKLRQGGTKELNEAELKLKIKEIQSLNFDLSENIGELFVSKKELSFQDTQSIARAFADYLSFEPPKNKEVNNIIAALACRHALVHSGGIVNDKTVKQISNAEPRDIQKDLSSKGTIMFKQEEVKIVGNSMATYLKSLSQGVSENLRAQ